MASQPPLSLVLRAGQTFDSYVVTPKQNDIAVTALRRLIHQDESGSPGDRLLLVWGPPGCGKTHLAVAAAWEAQQCGQRVAMLDLAGDEPVSPSWLEALHGVEFIVLEGLHLIPGEQEWETALFRLVDKVLLAGTTRMMVTSRMPPAKLSFALADLVSRLQWGLTVALRMAEQAALAEILEIRARRLGLGVEKPVIEYLLTRYKRDLPALLALLDELDRAGLAAQRRLTVPFVQRHLRDKELSCR
ncbi:MAG: DnaA/Hda family protein [Pseudomonadota bacterium]|nr:DnaA/Hda family protein [Pseudomonadota bacterium]